MKSSLSPSLTIRTCPSWAVWKFSLAMRTGARLRYDDSDDQYLVWFYDGNEAYTFAMWQGTVPSGVVADGYSQAQNDSDKADFEANYKPDANAPLAQLNYDGRPITQPVTLGSGQWHYWHGEGDDVVSTPQTVGGGTPFEATLSTTGDLPVTWEYRDPVWIAGGYFKYQGAQMSDHVSFLIYAPATVVTPNGGGTGNCNVVSGVIVPAAGCNTGAYDVDLTTATPVPTSDFAPYSGYWNYALPADLKGRGTITPGAPGTSKYHLLAVDMSLDRFVNAERLLGDGVNYYEPQNINVSLCLPGWRFKCTVHNDNGAHMLEATWRVLVSRYWTT